MKKVLCVLLVALMLMGTSFAEDYSLWHNLRFGMTEDEILTECKDIKVVVDFEGKKWDVASGPYFVIDKSLCSGAFYNMTWKVDEGLRLATWRHVEEIANIPNVEVFFGFNDNGGMKHVLYEYGGVGSHSYEKKQENIKNYYESLVSRLTAKYGRPLSGNEGYPQYDGGITTIVKQGKNKGNSFYFKSSAEWLIDIGEGNYLKIECAYDLTRNILLWSYSFIGKVEMNAGLSIYNDL